MRLSLDGSMYQLFGVREEVSVNLIPPSSATSDLHGFRYTIHSRDTRMNVITFVSIS